MADVRLSGASEAATEAERVVVLVHSSDRNTAFLDSKLRRHVPRLYIRAYHVDHLIVVGGGGRHCLANGLLDDS